MTGANMMHFAQDKMKKMNCQNLPQNTSLTKRCYLSLHRILSLKGSGFLSAFLLTAVLFCPGQTILAQDRENTKASPDQVLKSNARVNPSTLAMELSIPIASLPGRGGTSMPLVFNYSSKVWRVQGGASYDTGGIRWTYGYPNYADGSVSGWTSTYGVPTMTYTFDDSEVYDCQANATGNSTEYGSPECGLSYVKRVRVTLPDGSSHEFLKDDGVYSFDPSSPSIDRNGTFLAVDGSRMRLEMVSTGGGSTLYLPDGSRYLFANNSTAEKFIDKNGNVLTFNSTSNGWTDTLGKSLSNPFPSPLPANYSHPEGTKSVKVPGIGMTDRTYQLVWKKLSNGALAAGEPTDYYDSDICNPVGRTNVLFVSDPPVRLCSTRGAGYFDPSVLTEIILPDGSRYKFQYNKFGEIVRIDYPIGGYEKFVYDKIAPLSSTRKPAYDQANRGVVSRIVGAGDGTTEYTWTYQAGYTGTVIDGSPYYVTTTAPDGTKTKQILHRNQADRKNYGFDNPLTGREMETQVIDTLGNIRSRTLTEWETTNGVSPGFAAYPKRDIRVKRIFNIVNDPATGSLISMTENKYDTDASSDPAQFSSLNLKWSKTYDYKVLTTTINTGDTLAALTIFTGTAPATISETTYLYDVNYRNRGIVGLATQTVVKDGTENVKAKSEITYDESGYLEWTSVSNPPGFEAPNTNYRALPTTMKSWYDVTNAQSFITTHTSYDQFGNPRKFWDGTGNFTETQYADNYTDNINRNSYALPTKTISYSGTGSTGTVFESYTKYDFNTGLPRYMTDANNQTSEMQYNDALLRSTKTIAPNGQQTITEYGIPASGQLPASQRFLRVKTQVDETNWKEGYIWFDGLARTIKTQSVDSSGDIFVETQYDVMSRPKKVTNPYRTGETKQWTENFYDDLSRVIKVKTPDNAEVENYYGLATSGTQIGTFVITEDQADKKRRSVTNALGQIIRVDEPDKVTGNLGIISSPVQPTYYKYNTLGKMIEVIQGVQQRHFLYDNLGRLLRVRQPEQQINAALNLSNPETMNTQWTVGFSYDANGNLLTTTDAKNVTTTNIYDALNRVTKRIYSDGVTPTVNFTYDDANVPFSKGKLTKVSSTISEIKYTIYDTMGRLVSSEQATDGQIFPTNYKYNLAGTMTEETYPSGRIVKNFLEADGDLAAISSKVMNGRFRTYASNFAYTASGVIEHLQIGSGLWESAKMNSRNQVTELRLGTSPIDGSLWKLNYDYGELNANTVDATKNAGNIAKQSVSFSGLSQPFVQTYKYDSLDRITEAKETSGTNQTWIQNWSYDRYGNRTQFSQNILGRQLAINNQTLPVVDTNTNKFQAGQGYTYDANGNLIGDTSGRQFTFDGDNKQTLVKDASNNIVGRYFYDGNGKRVKKVTNSETTIFVYDGTNKLVAEYSTATPVQNPTVNYTATDPLGSPRVLTNSRKEIVSRRDFMPFGEELAPDATYRTANLKYGTGDNIRQKFTGYQRDEETQLDFAEARYYNNSHGRFTAVDPLLASGKSANPQTFNRYVYTMNRPLILTDPTGLQVGKKLIPLPEPLLQLASLDTRSGISDKGESISFTLTPDEVNQRIELATLAYNEGFEAGERNAQELLGQNVEVNSVESVDSLSSEKSKEISTETGISISPKDVGISEKQTDKIGTKDTNNGSYKVGGKVESGLSESIAGTKNLAEARQTVINEQSSKVRDIVGKNDQSTKSKVNVTPTVDDLIQKSTILGKSHGRDSYIKSNLIKQE